jgi:hypothetical protein
VKAALATTGESFGGLDLLLINAGYGSAGPLDSSRHGRSHLRRS